MTYREYSVQVKVSGYLGRPLTGRFKEIHDFLTGLWDGMECVVDERDNRIVLQKGGDWYFVHRFSHSGHLECAYERVWTFFTREMGMEQTRDFVRGMVGDRLRCELDEIYQDWDRYEYGVEDGHESDLGCP